MTHSVWPADNTVVLSLEGLKNRAGEYQNSATVTLVSLVDLNGNSVSGITYPLSLTYVTDSDGNYEVEIGPTVGVTAGKKYRGTVKAVSGTLTFQAVETILVQERKE